MNNGMDPDKMTGPERLDELSMLLALAMIRVWLRRRQERTISRDFGRDSLGNPAETRPTVGAGKP
jgi:hypothetical protein